MKQMEQPHIYEIVILKKSIHSSSLVFNKGDEVQIIGKSDKGYNLMQVDSGNTIFDCNADVFK